MALSNLEYKQIMQAYEQRRLSNYQLLEDRKKELHNKLPRIKEIDKEIAANSIAFGRKLINSDQLTLREEFRKSQDLLLKEKKELLESNGYPSNYLEPIYQCVECKDTGYIGSNRCSCFKKELTHLLYSNSNMERILTKENFQTFREDYYSNQPMNNGLLSPRANIQGILNLCHKFVDDFPKGENILFQGSTGVGKTFLSHCIAKEIMDNGHTCVYVTAFQLFEDLAKQAFGKKDNEKVNITTDLLLNCDLLIIDDLGTELANKFVITQLFQCLNERLLREKSTIISTNLSSQQFRDIYSERIFSRILENYARYTIYGDDIRVQKSDLTQVN